MRKCSFMIDILGSMHMGVRILMPMGIRILLPIGIRNFIMRCHSIKAASTDFGWNRIDQKQRFRPCDMIQGSGAHLGFRGCALYNNIYLRLHIGMYAVASDVRYDLHGVYVDYILPASAADLSFWPRLPACRKVWSKRPSSTSKTMIFHGTACPLR